jgi:MFS family permease
VANTFVGPPLGGLLAALGLAIAFGVPAAAYLVGAACLALTGVTMVLWNVITVSLRQRITPDRLLGRMNASYRLVGWGTMPLGALLGGVLAEALGLRATFLVAAGIVLLTLAGFRYLTEEAIADAEAAEAPTG